jgi:hypothetical protein
MNVNSRTTKAELAEIVRGLDVDIDVVQVIITQLRRLDSGWPNEGPYFTTNDRRSRALRMVERYLDL